MIHAFHNYIISLWDLFRSIFANTYKRAQYIETDNFLKSFAFCQRRSEFNLIAPYTTTELRITSQRTLIISNEYYTHEQIQNPKTHHFYAFRGIYEIIEFDDFPEYSGYYYILEITRLIYNHLSIAPMCAPYIIIIFNYPFKWLSYRCVGFQWPNII